MSDFYILEKGKLKDFLGAVLNDFYLVAPAKASQGDFLFQEIEDLERINLDYDITANTLKEFFFPAREALFEYEKKDKGFKVRAAKEGDKRPALFFGLRSCDIRAVHFQDQFFSQEPADNLYWQKRNKSILIGLSCNKPARQSCFCNHTAAFGPVLEKGEGFDLQFMDIGRDYLVEVGSDKGKSLLKKYKWLFVTADNLQEKKSQIRNSCLKHFQKEYDLKYIYEKLKEKNLKELWEDLGKRCTNCAGCEFICPTCFCFSTQDINYARDKGARIRAWDSCTFSGYSRMSGDINPHEKNSERISRRFFCKLYNCYNWFRQFACTGCGRCSFVCPVNLDMESFLAGLMQEDKYKPLLKEL